MDKNTLSNYGWIVIAVLVLSVMIALATPFGTYIENGVRSTTAGLFETSEKAMNVVGMSAGSGDFEDGYTGVGGSGNASTVTLPAKGKTLEEYTWAEVQQIVQAGKATEYGFAVGQTKTLTMMAEKSTEVFENMTKTATIIGINHDGNNTATFMILDSIGSHVMNIDGASDGGWKDSEMREWLNGDIYNSMSNKDCIKEVTKMTNNVGYHGTTATSTSDKVFLLSAKEAGVADDIAGWSIYPEEYKPVLETEGTTYTWFESNTIEGWFWLRSSQSNDNGRFFVYEYGSFINEYAHSWYRSRPAFVIG